MTVRTVFVLAIVVAVAFGLLAVFSADEKPPEFDSSPSGDVDGAPRVETATLDDAADNSPNETRTEVSTTESNSDHDAPVPDAELEVVERKSLFVVVVDPAGQPVAKASVSVGVQDALGGRVPISMLRALYPGIAEPPPNETTLTDARGRAEIRLHPEHVALEATKSGLGSSGELTIPPGPHPEWEPWRIVLRAPQQLTGIVLTADGRAMAGAGVTGMRTFDEGMPAPLDPTTSDARGEFAFDLADPGHYVVQAYHGDVTTDSVRVLVEDGQSPARVELRMQGAFAFRGVVYDAHGELSAAAEVQLWRLDGAKPDQFPYSKIAKTNSAGQFEILLGRGGNYRLVSTADGMAHSRLLEQNVDAANPRRDVVLRLRSEVSIRGRVTDASGVGIGGLRAVAGLGAKRDEFGIYLFDLFGPYPAAEATTDERGEFVLDGLNPDALYEVRVFLDLRRYRLTLNQDGVQGGTVGLVLVADPDKTTSARVRGSVVRAATLEPIESFELRLWKHYPDDVAYPEDIQFELDEGRPGTFVLRDLAIDKEYSVVIKATGLPPTWVPRWRVTDPETRVVVEIPEFGGIDATLVDASGAVVANHTVRVEDLAVRPEYEALPPLVSDNAGNARAQLPPGRYRLSAGAEQRVVVIDAGETTVIRVRAAARR